MQVLSKNDLCIGCLEALENTSAVGVVAKQQQSFVELHLYAVFNLMVRCVPFIYETDVPPGVTRMLRCARYSTKYAFPRNSGCSIAMKQVRRVPWSLLQNVKNRRQETLLVSQRAALNC